MKFLNENKYFKFFDEDHLEDLSDVIKIVLIGLICVFFSLRDLSIIWIDKFTIQSILWDFFGIILIGIFTGYIFLCLKGYFPKKINKLKMGYIRLLIYFILGYFTMIIVIILYALTLIKISSDNPFLEIFSVLFFTLFPYKILSFFDIGFKRAVTNKN